MPPIRTRGPLAPVAPSAPASAARSPWTLVSPSELPAAARVPSAVRPSPRGHAALILERTVVSDHLVPALLQASEGAALAYAHASRETYRCTLSGAAALIGRAAQHVVQNNPMMRREARYSPPIVSPAQLAHAHALLRRVEMRHPSIYAAQALRAGRTNEAIAYSREALALDPTSPDARRALLAVLVAHGDAASLRDDALPLLGAAPTFEEAYPVAMALARVHEHALAQSVGLQLQHAGLTQPQLEALLALAVAAPGASARGGDGAKLDLHLMVRVFETLLRQRPTQSRPILLQLSWCHGLFFCLREMAWGPTSSPEVRHVLHAVGQAIARQDVQLRQMSLGDMHRLLEMYVAFAQEQPVVPRLQQLLEVVGDAQARAAVLECFIGTLQRQQGIVAPNEALLLLGHLDAAARAQLSPGARDGLREVLDRALGLVLHSGEQASTQAIVNAIGLDRLDWVVLLGRLFVWQQPPSAASAQVYAALELAGKSPQAWVQDEALEVRCDFLRGGHVGQLVPTETQVQTFVELAMRRAEQGDQEGAQRLAREALAFMCSSPRSKILAEQWLPLSELAGDRSAVLAALQVAIKQNHDTAHRVQMLQLWAQLAKPLHDAPGAYLEAFVEQLPTLQGRSRPLNERTGELGQALFRSGHHALCQRYLLARFEAWRAGRLQLRPHEAIYLRALRDLLGQESLPTLIGFVARVQPELLDADERQAFGEAQAEVVALSLQLHG
jgi:hypothetical protein